MRLGITPGTGPGGGGPLLEDFDPASVIHLDSRRHAGPGDPYLLNYGSAGDVWDLDVIEIGPDFYWGIKRFNWYSQGTTGNGSYPASWDDFGGTPMSGGPFFYVTHVSPRFDGSVEDMAIENEFYVNPEIATDLSWGSSTYVDYYDGPNAADGFASMYWGDLPEDYTQDIEYTVQDAGPYGGNIRSNYADCTIAFYLNPVTREQGFWMYDGLQFYSFEHTFAFSTFLYEDATYEWLYLWDQLDGHTPVVGSGTISRLFFSFAYHDSDLYGPLGGYGTPWGQCTGVALTRPSVAQQADLDQYVRDWWTYWSSDLGDLDLLNPGL